MGQQHKFHFHIFDLENIEEVSMDLEDTSHQYKNHKGKQCHNMDHEEYTPYFCNIHVANKLWISMGLEDKDHQHIPQKHIVG